MLNGIDWVHSPMKYTYIATRLTWQSANQTAKNLSEIISLGLINTLKVFWRQTNQKSLLVLQRTLKCPGKSVSTNTLRIRISPEPEKYTLDNVFPNLRTSSYQWKRKTEF